MNLSELAKIKDLDRAQTIVSIQILRALAAWAVVFHHYMQLLLNYEAAHPLSQFFATYGQLGVEVFFIISGLVMYHALHWRPVSGGAFAINRILRIVPVYWIATFTLILVAAVGLADPNYRYTFWTGETLFYSLFFVPHEHPDGIRISPTLMVGWTLNFEMFFYGVLAICVWVLRRHVILIAALTLTALPFLASESWPLAHIMTSYLLFLFVIGIVIYWAYLKGVFTSLGPLPSLLLGFTILSISLVYMIKFGPGFRIVAPTGIVIGMLCLENILRDSAGWFVAGLRHLGDLSYSSYLFHPIILVCLLNFLGVPQSYFVIVGSFLATVILTYLASVYGYRFIEQPCSRLAKKLTRRPAENTKAA